MRYGVEAARLDAHKVLSGLHIRQAVVIGAGFGGLAALRLAARKRAVVDRLVILDAVPDMLTDCGTPGPSPELHGQRFVTAQDAWRDASRLICPTLLVRGSRSHLVPRQRAKDFARAAHADFEEVDSGHDVAIDAPGALIRILGRFLLGDAPPAPAADVPVG